jgi:hypothetical protein
MDAAQQTLADVKLPQSHKEKELDRQVKRLRLLSDNLIENDSEAISDLGELLGLIAE